MQMEQGSNSAITNSAFDSDSDDSDFENAI